MPTYSGDFIANLKPGDHLCCLYETEEEHQALLTPFLRQGLEQGEKVLYIVDAHTAEHVLGYLRDDGLDVEPYLVHDQLAILTSDYPYMREGRFDPDGMIALLRAEMEQAMSEGYPALRLTGEMTWALRGLPGSERLMEYEAKLNEFFPGSQCLAICQYDRRRFQPEVLSEVLCTHPLAIIGNEVYDNSYYMPPAEFLGEDQPTARLRNWLRNLADRKRVEAEAVERAERLEALHLVSQAIGGSLDLESVGAVALEQVIQVLDLDGGLVRYLDEDTQELVLICQLGLPQELAQALHAFPRVKLGQGLSALIAQTGEPLIVDDVAQDARTFHPATRQSGLPFYVGLPLKVGGRVVGVLSGLSHRWRPFTPADMGLMADLGNMVGMAIANARLFEQVEAKGREWEHTFNSLGEGVGIISPDFRFLRANQALARMVGITSEALVGRHCYEVIHGLDRPLADCHVTRCMATGLAHEMARQEPHLGDRWLRMRADPVLGPHNELLGVVHSMRDITSDKLRIDELDRVKRNLEAANEELESMILIVSHDLRAPIISIQGFISALTRGHAQALGDKGQFYLERITRNTQHLDSLIGELMELSRVGRHMEPREMVNTGEMVAGVAEELEPQIQGAGAEVAIAESMPQVFCERRRLRQAFLNLIGNTIRFTGDQSHPRIEVGYEDAGESWHFWVRDNGMGIAPEDQGRLFMVFQTLGRVPEKEGSGVGLAIVKRVAESHGGRAWVESEGRGQGSTFHLTIAKPPQEGV